MRTARIAIDSPAFAEDNQVVIGFGELRKRTLEWQVDLSTVERVYALDWLLAGLFDHSTLGPALSLRGATALSKAFFPTYPQATEAELSLTPELDPPELQSLLIEVARSAAARSGMQYRLLALIGREARFEYTGPLGRRSAAQPHLPVRLFRSRERLAPVGRPLLHPFSDAIETQVRTSPLAELAAEGLVLLSGHPRARDLYDLWFILTHADKELEPAVVRRLALEIAAEKGIHLRAELDPVQRPLIARAWQTGLRKIRNPPLLDDALRELQSRTAGFFFA